MVEEAEPHLMGARQVEWLDRLEAEQENLRAALEWSQAPGGDTEVGLRMSGALLWYWQTRGYLGEVRERLAALLARPEASERTEARSKALLVAGRLATHQGDFASARSAFAENLEIRRELAEPLGIAHALIALGSAFTGLGEYAAARAIYTEGVGILERGHATPYKAMALVGLGEATLYSGDSEGAKPLLEASLELFKSGGNKGGAAFALALLGLLAYGKAEYEAATRLFEESLALRRELGSKQAIAQSLLGLAELANTRGDAQRAATILGAIPSLLDDAGARMAPTDEARYRRNLDAARARLDDTGWETVWEEGHAMPVDQVIAYALGS
jgi:non-specific serine/threonine protein kinase